MSIRFYFLWFDAWMGVFVDRSNRRVYIQPLPCVGVRITLAGQEVAS